METADGFDRDEANLDKCRKHGLTRELIESVFDRTVSVFPDPSHSQWETRFPATGTTAVGRHVFMAFTFRARDGKRLVTPISARCMHAKEGQHFEAQAAQPRK